MYYKNKPTRFAAIIKIIAVFFTRIRIFAEGTGFGHKSFSAEKVRDPASARQPPAFKSVLAMLKHYLRRVQDLNL